MLRLSSNPGDLEGLIEARPRVEWIVIDEIQRVPALLPEVHRLIEATRPTSFPAIPTDSFVTQLPFPAGGLTGP